MKTGAKLFLEQAPCLISNNELLEDLQRFKEHLEIGLQSYSIDISKLHKLFKM